eukprot:TRINITY_DN1507_c0_g1_i3.p1 TRINITY_DN1507_c0_g1~~TRINITY_DN1507_c0_g1_i3.p1  ORF type:complete len:703 (+),score=135.77 TRINITY_DN1507_c0_g1_i3:75-2111(+)
MASALGLLAALAAAALGSAAAVSGPSVRMLVPSGSGYDVVVGGDVQAEFGAVDVGDTTAPLLTAETQSVAVEWWWAPPSPTATLQYEMSYNTIALGCPTDPAGSVAAVNLATSGSVTELASRFTVGMTCTDTFTVAAQLSFALTLLDNETAVTLPPLVFALRWACYAPGCSEYCTEHGSCRYLLGTCECTSPWVGPYCALQFSMSHEICPQDSLFMAYYVPRNVVGYENGGPTVWYTIETALVTIDWRYFSTWSTLLPADDDPRTNETASGMQYVHLYLEPSSTPYGVGVYVGNNKPVLYYDYVTVKDWSECGYVDTACGEGLTNQCGSDLQHGECVDGACSCATGRFWFDCSRGCDTLAVLTNSSGGFASDTPPAGANSSYLDDTICSWLLSPVGDFDEIRITFTLFDIDVGDSVAVYQSDSHGVQGRRVTVITGDVAPLVVVRAKHALVIFSADYATTGLGFAANYSTRRVVPSAVWLSLLSILLPFVLLLAAVAVVATIACRQFSVRRQMEKVNVELAQQNEQLRIALFGQISQQPELLSTPAERVIRTLQTMKDTAKLKPSDRENLDFVIGVIAARKLYTVNTNPVADTLETDIKDFLYDQVELKKETPYNSGGTPRQTPRSTERALSPIYMLNDTETEENINLDRVLDNWDFNALGLSYIGILEWEAHTHTHR